MHHFLHSCEVFLEGAKVNYERNTVLYEGRETKIASYPVSVDVAALRRIARSPRVQDYEERLRPYFGEQTIVRVDRAEPSKNIARGLKAFDVLLERYPHLVNRVKLICFVVPSRSGIKQYERYTQEIFDAVNAINAKYGNDESQPVKLYFENNYAQSLAGMRLYDVLLVNPVIDGMNLVAKEGPIVNTQNGVLVLSESAGAYEQLKDYSISVAPADLEGTTQALYDALTMSMPERKRRAEGLKRTIEAEDLTMWLYHQFRDLRNHACQLPMLLAV
ncbi:MAG: trehalose-6-phosphate synthase [Chloroflexi bacterium]|nr:trehalose-6-phosphate synthase [Chloroflexota bacterium]